MKARLVLKLLGCAALIFAGYFLMAAVGWPEPLDSMTLERGFVGGMIILLGVLCAIAALVPDRSPDARPAAEIAAPIEPPPVMAAPVMAAPAALSLVEADQEPEAPHPFWAAPPPPEAFPSNAEPEPKPELEPAPEPAPEPEPEPEREPEPLRPAAQPEPAELAPAEPRPVADAAPKPHPASLATVRDLLAKGDKLFNEEALEDALEPYSQALDSARALHAVAPDDATRDLMAESLKAVGDVHDEVGRLDAATDHYEQAVRIRTEQLAAAPDDPSRKRALSLLLERLGDTRDTRGHVTRALDLYRQSLTIAESLVAAAPDNPVYAEDLAATRRRIAELERPLSD